MARRNITGRKRVDNEKELITTEDLKLLNTFTEGGIETTGNEESTYHIKQETIQNSADLQSGIKKFDLHLSSGPYKIDYTRDGRYLLLTGFKGHFSAFEWQTGKLRFERNLERDEIRDSCWLQDELFFAMAQNKYIYIYDHHGIEVHRFKKSTDPHHLQFLPNHFLLTSVGKDGIIRYQDISHGDVVAEWSTKMGPSQSMSMNPQTGVVGLAHASGMVSFWSPTVNGPLLKMLCHKGPVQAISFDHAGDKFATAGLDGKVKIWDLRNYKPVETYETLRPVSSLDFSQKGLLSSGCGPHVTIYDPRKHKKTIYLSHFIEGSMVEKVKFCPFEDVLGVGHLNGFSSLLVPGAGEPQFDSLVANPYGTKKQRRERQVRQLLDKLQPETIVMDPSKIGTVRVVDDNKNLEKEEATDANIEEPLERTKETDEKDNDKKKSSQGQDETSPPLSKQNDLQKSKKQPKRQHRETKTKGGKANDDCISALSRFRNKNI